MSNAVNVSLTRLREYERGHRRNYFVIFEIALFVIIIGLLLVTLGSGVNVYRNISDQRWADEQNRTGLTLIANSVHITDTIDAVGIGAGPEGQALVLTEVFSTGSYETRIYLYHGYIVEEYAIAGTPYTPERAAALIQSDHFSFSYSGGLLTVNTDRGEENIMLHSVRKADTKRTAAEATEATEASGTGEDAATAETTEASENTEDAEAPETAEATEASEASENSETSEASETVETTVATEDTESAEAVEATEDAEATQGGEAVA